MTISAIHTRRRTVVRVRVFDTLVNVVLTMFTCNIDNNHDVVLQFAKKRTLISGHTQAYKLG
jgi:hypothetical protein